MVRSVLILVSCLFRLIAAIPINTLDEVEILSVGDNEITIRFNAISNSDYYTIEVLLAAPAPDNSYNEPHYFQLSAGDFIDKHVTSTLPIHLIPASNYDVILYATTTIGGVQQDQGPFTGRFETKECASQILCSRMDSHVPQCLRVEWRCNGVIECAEGFDETYCDDDIIIDSNFTEVSTDNPTGLEEAPPCVLEQQESNRWYLLHEGQEGGPRWPHCDGDGSYSAKQCEYGGAMTCYCVDRDGGPLGNPVTPFNPIEHHDFETQCKTLRGEAIPDGSEDTDGFYDYLHY